MKDLPHFMKKLYRQTVRSLQRTEEEEATTPELPPRERSIREQKKIAKRKITKERNERTPIHLTPEERNKKMKHRVPIFDRLNNAKPKGTKKSLKKTPRI